MSPAQEQVSIRTLPAYVLDLLGPEDRARVEAALTGNPSLREALDAIRSAAGSWGTEEHPSESVWKRLAEGRTPVSAEELEHLLACRECRFVAAVVLSGTTGAERDAEPSPPLQGERRRGRWIRPALSLAAGLTLGVLGFGLGSRGPDAPAVGRSVVLDLSAERGATQEPTAPLSGVEGVTLAVETVFPPTSGQWILTGPGGTEVAAGRLEFEPGSPTLRVISLHVPASRLEPGSYLLQVRAEDGSVDRQWRFRTR